MSTHDQMLSLLVFGELFMLSSNQNSYWAAFFEAGFAIITLDIAVAQNRFGLIMLSLAALGLFLDSFKRFIKTWHRE